MCTAINPVVQLDLDEELRPYLEVQSLKEEIAKFFADVKAGKGKTARAKLGETTILLDRLDKGVGDARESIQRRFMALAELDGNRNKLEFIHAKAKEVLET